MKEEEEKLSGRWTSAELGVNQCCKTCRFKWDGECHRNPPFLMIVGHKYDPVWPRVKDHQWCGEYKEQVIVDGIVQPLHQLGLEYEELC